MVPAALELETVAQGMDDHNKAATEQGVAAMTNQMAVTVRIGFILAGIAAVVLVATAFFLFFTIARPVRALTGAMQELAGGKFDLVLPGLGRKDEIGDIAGAVETFKVKAAEKAQIEADEVSGVSGPKRGAGQGGGGGGGLGAGAGRIGGQQAEVVEQLASGCRACRPAT